MRIAIYHNLPSGGAKRTLYEATKRLASRHQIDFFSLSTANHTFGDVRTYANRHKVFEFLPHKLLKSPFGRLNQAFRLRDLIRIKSLGRLIAREIEEGQYDVFFAEPCQYEIGPSPLRYVKNVPTSYYCHEPLRRLYEPMPARPYQLTSVRLRSLFNRLDPFPALYHSKLKVNDLQNTQAADQILVNSRYTLQSVEQIYGTKANICYHGVDANWFQPLEIKKAPMLLSVGSLTPLKGFDFLIEAIGQIPKKERLTLVIASNFQNSPEREYLNGLAELHKVDLKLLDNVTEQRLRELYNQALITVYAPIREPFGLVALESMACGTPVVGVREGGLAETIIPGETGYTVERDAKSFANAVQRLLENPSLARELGANGRAKVLKSWTWDQSVDILEKYLEAVRI